MAEQNPNLMSKAQMTTMSNTLGSGKLLMHEILTKVNNAKDKPKKIAVLKEHDTPSLRRVISRLTLILHGIYQKVHTPYMANERQRGTEHTYLENESRTYWHYVTGADNTLSKTRKETMFIQSLEGLSKGEASKAVRMKDKELHKHYKGLSTKLVKEVLVGMMTIKHTEAYKEVQHLVRYLSSTNHTHIGGGQICRTPN